MPSDNLMDTLSETINSLQRKGYSNNFKIENGKFICEETKKVYSPSELKIINTFRFEGKSNPDDMSVLFVLETSDNTKGIFIEAYGAYSLMEDYNSDLIKGLKNSTQL